MKYSENNHRRRKKVQGFLYETSFFLELIAAVFVIALILFQFAGLAMDMFSNAGDLLSSENLNKYLEVCLNIVIGIEFLKMLCRHNIDAVIEVLLFTLARHLIVTNCTMLESLICVVAIAVLFGVRKFLFSSKQDKPKKDKTEEMLLGK